MEVGKCCNAPPARSARRSAYERPDHLAGSVHANELVKHIRDEHRGDPLSPFASELLPEIQSDREVLEELAKRAGGGPNAIKQATAWAAERLAQLRLGQDREGLGAFESLEHLALGIQGKLALWRVLAKYSADERLQGVDFQGLARRAHEQHAKVEEQRLLLAAGALQLQSARAKTA
jgi:hypothetical protein